MQCDLLYTSQNEQTITSYYRSQTVWQPYKEPIIFQYSFYQDHLMNESTFWTVGDTNHASQWMFCSSCQLCYHQSISPKYWVIHTTRKQAHCTLVMMQVWISLFLSFLNSYQKKFNRKGMYILNVILLRSNHRFKDDY